MAGTQSSEPFKTALHFIDGGYQRYTSRIFARLRNPPIHFPCRFVVLSSRYNRLGHRRAVR